MVPRELAGAMNELQTQIYGRLRGPGLFLYRRHGSGGRTAVSLISVIFCNGLSFGPADG